MKNGQGAQSLTCKYTEKLAGKGLPTSWEAPSNNLEEMTWEKVHSGLKRQRGGLGLEDDAHLEMQQRAAETAAAANAEAENAPNPAAIPPGDLLGVTVVLIACAYRGQEFLRVGYYVSNEAPEHDVPTAQTVTRTVLAENPRVTRVDIDWLAPKPADAYAAPAFSFS